MTEPVEEATRTTPDRDSIPPSRLAEIVRAALAGTDLREVLERIARAAMEETGAACAAVFLVDRKSRKLALAGAAGLEAGPDRAETARTLARAAEGALRRRATALPEDGAKRAVPGAGGDPEEEGTEPGTAGAAIVAAPIRFPGEVGGALVVCGEGEEAGDFRGADRASILEALSDLAALLIDRARQREAALAASRDLSETRGRLVEVERMAALGEIGTRMARELRTPVASIAGFARKLERSLAANAPAREFLDIILAEAERVERLCSEQLQFADLTHPRLRLEDLNRVTEEVLAVHADEIRRKRARLIRRLAPDLPDLLLDTDRIRQVLRNIFQNTLAAVPEDGRFKVETKRIGEYAQVVVAGDGTRVPGELLDRLFVPFAASRAGGSGLGLAVASQIVREHGGEIGVRSDPDWAVVFTVTFPIKRNSDRRRRMKDRRNRFEDRRNDPGTEP